MRLRFNGLIEDRLVANGTTGFWGGPPSAPAFPEGVFTLPQGKVQVALQAVGFQPHLHRLTFTPISAARGGDEADASFFVVVDSKRSNPPNKKAKKKKMKSTPCVVQ